MISPTGLVDHGKLRERWQADAERLIAEYVASGTGDEALRAWFLGEDAALDRWLGANPLADLMALFESPKGAKG